MIGLSISKTLILSYFTTRPPLSGSLKRPLVGIVLPSWEHFSHVVGESSLVKDWLLSAQMAKRSPPFFRTHLREFIVTSPLRKNVIKNSISRWQCMLMAKADLLESRIPHVVTAMALQLRTLWFVISSTSIHPSATTPSPTQGL